MDDASKRLEDNSKDALEAYLRYMWSGYHKWYVRAVAANQFLWHATQTVVIAAGFGTAVLAALSGQPSIRDSSVCRVAMIILPLLGTLAGTIAANAKVGARWELREQGRREIQRLVDSGRQRFAAATSQAEYAEIHVALVDAVQAVEAAQAANHFPLLSSEEASTNRAAPSK